MLRIARNVSSVVRNNNARTSYLMISKSLVLQQQKLRTFFSFNPNPHRDAMVHQYEQFRNLVDQLEKINAKNRLNALKRAGDNYLKNKISDSNELNELLSLLPSDHERYEFIKLLKPNIENIRLNWLSKTIAILGTKKQDFLNLLETQQIKQSLEFAHDIGSVLQVLPITDRLSFLKGLGKNFLQAKLKFNFDLEYILPRLNKEDQLEILTLLDFEYLKKLIQHNFDLEKILKILHVDNHFFFVTVAWWQISKINYY